MNDVVGARGSQRKLHSFSRAQRNSLRLCVAQRVSKPRLFQFFVQLQPILGFTLLLLGRFIGPYRLCTHCTIFRSVLNDRGPNCFLVPFTLRTFHIIFHKSIIPTMQFHICWVLILGGRTM